MSRYTGKFDGDGVPSIDLCLYHRCVKHLRVPQLNHEESSGAECGGCLAEEVIALIAWRGDHLALTAELLIAHAQLRRRLAELGVDVPSIAVDASPAAASGGMRT
jgi:hypothetical protein